MNRQVKFRVWDEKAQVMAYDDLGAYCNVDVGMTLCYEDCVLMQHTGLNDKHGTPIYEGDILSSTSELLTNFGRVKTGKYSTTVKEVFWKEDSWANRVLKSDVVVIGSESKGLTVVAKYGEVIGNIYENPELLEVKS